MARLQVAPSGSAVIRIAATYPPLSELAHTGRQEALKRLAAGETQAVVARTYAVDPTTIGRLLTGSP